MGDVGQTLYPFLRHEGMVAYLLQIQVIAVYNVFKMIELPNVNDGSWSITANEDDNNAQEDHVHVDFLP